MSFSLDFYQAGSVLVKQAFTASQGKIFKAGLQQGASISFSSSAVSTDTTSTRPGSCVLPSPTSAMVLLGPESFAAMPQQLAGVQCRSVAEQEVPCPFVTDTIEKRLQRR
ncbi:hypothetical protein [Porticoccus sp.]